MKISILLPYKENFSSNYAGAVSLFVKDTVKNSKYFNTTYNSFGWCKRQRSWIDHQNSSYSFQSCDSWKTDLSQAWTNPGHGITHDCSLVWSGLVHLNEIDRVPKSRKQPVSQFL